MGSLLKDAVLHRILCPGSFSSCSASRTVPAWVPVIRFSPAGSGVLSVDSPQASASFRELPHGPVWIAGARSALM